MQWWPKASLLCGTQVREDGGRDIYDHLEDYSFSSYKWNISCILTNTIPCVVKNVIHLVVLATKMAIMIMISLVSLANIIELMILIFSLYSVTWLHLFLLINLHLWQGQHTAQCILHTAPAPAFVHFILHTKQCTMHITCLYCNPHIYNFTLHTIKSCLSGYSSWWWQN